MRKANKEIRDVRVIADLLNACHVGRLATSGPDGYPMIKPLNFVYREGRIYFHSAREGEKIDHIRRDGRVCFETDLPIALVKGDDNPCRAEYLYRSVIVKGRAHIVDKNEEKVFALKCLMEKYQPEGGYGQFADEKLSITSVVRIDVEEMTGKEDLGKGAMRERVLRVLEEKGSLPVVLTAGE